MKLISWNVNGIRSIHNKGLFVPFIEKERPDIICLQETKAEEHQSAVDLPDYEEYWNSAKKKGYSGTAIFCKARPLSVRLGLPEATVQKYKINSDTYGDPNDEGRVIAAEFKDYFVINVYTPNAKPDLSRLALRHKQWDPAFLAYCKQLDKEKPLIVCGDLNVAHTEKDLAKEERAGIDAIIAGGFVDSYRHFTKDGGHYTWWSHFANSRARNVGWRLDYIFVSGALAKRMRGASILSEARGSDHCPIELIVDL
jgi:exodeoxyribonuclease III